MYLDFSLTDTENNMMQFVSTGNQNKGKKNNLDFESVLKRSRKHANFVFKCKAVKLQLKKK